MYSHLTHPTQRHRTASIAALATLIAAVLLVTASPSRAATDADLRMGVYTDVDGVAFGGGLLAEMGSSWFFNPNIEAAFADPGNLYTLNADFHYDIPAATSLSFYMGAGPALLIADPDRGDADTEVGLNLLAGFAGQNGPVRPFAQIKGIIADGSELALVGGIRF